MVRALGIEPRTPAWKAGVLPLNYARVQRVLLIYVPRHRQGDLGDAVFTYLVRQEPHYEKGRNRHEMDMTPSRD